jgi:hypothetical protein
MMAKYRKLPVVIEAFKWTGDQDQVEDPEWIIEAIREEKVSFSGYEMFIDTLEGKMAAFVGDYVIKGIKGEIYPCKPDIFEATYELVESEE